MNKTNTEKYLKKNNHVDVEKFLPILVGKKLERQITVIFFSK